MQQMIIIKQFINSICRRDKPGLEKVLSGRPVIIFNDQELVETPSAQYSMDQFHKHVEAEGAKKYVVKAEKRSFFKASEGYSHLDVLCRLIAFGEAEACEGRFWLSVSFAELEIKCVQMISQEILTKNQIVNTKNGTVILPESQIYYLESDNNHIRWHCKGGEYRERATMNERAKLLSDRFVNVRKSHWVNMDFVISLCNYDMRVFPGDVIAVPRAKLKAVKKRLLAWNEL